jgi:hypothetical protein
MKGRMNPVYPEEVEGSWMSWRKGERTSRTRRRDLEETLEEFRGSGKGGGIWRKGGKDLRDLEDSEKAGRLGGFGRGGTRCGAEGVERFRAMKVKSQLF